MSYEQDEANKKKIEMYCEKQDLMESARWPTQSHWQECMEFIVPRKNDVTSTRQPGDKRGNELFDSTAIISNELLASALHAMLTNPAQRFFELIMGDPQIDIQEDVREWLQTVADRMFTVMNNSNFQTEVHEVYIDLGSIGTACMYMGEHKEKIVHFNARAMKEIYVQENNLGLIDTVHRKFKWKPKQMVQEFGEKKVPKIVQDAYQKGNHEDWTVIHAVQSEYDAKGSAKFNSCYFLKEQKVILSEDKFNEFPYAVPRWTKTSGEVYGRGPGMSTLPEIKMINAMKQSTIEGAQLTIRPPMMVSDDGVIGKVRLTPGGLTVVRPMSGNEAPIKPLMMDSRIDFGIQIIEQTQMAIKKGFYVDQLQMPSGPQMTATEVSQRTEEQMRLMGPVLGRQHFEFLKPVIERVFGIMSRRGMFPPAPQSIQGKKFDVRYSSLIARAQRMSDGQNLSRAIQTAAPIIQMKPESIDILNTDKALQYIFELYGIPQKIMNSSRDVQKSRDAKAQAQQQASQEMQQQHQADVVSKVAPGTAQLIQAQKGAPQQ